MSNILVGDCVELMAAMPECSVDAIVTDPPYGLGFMGKEWDNFVPGRVPDRWAPADGSAGYGPGTRQGSAMAAGKYDRSLSSSHEFQRWFTERNYVLDKAASERYNIGRK